MHIMSHVYQNMIYCPSVPPETGGIIGTRDGIVSEILFDTKVCINDRAIYVPDIQNLNHQIQLWSEQNILFGGIFHSHPQNEPRLSSDDIRYIHEICSAMPIKINSLFFPIILPGIKMFSFKAIRRDGGIYICEDEVCII